MKHRGVNRNFGESESHERRWMGLELGPLGQEPSFLLTRRVCGVQRQAVAGERAPGMPRDTGCKVRLVGKHEDEGKKVLAPSKGLCPFPKVVGQPCRFRKLNQSHVPYLGFPQIWSRIVKSSFLGKCRHAGMLAGQ